MSECAYVKVPVPTSLLIGLKKQSLDERKSFPKYIKPVSDLFQSELTKLFYDTQSKKEKQIEESKAITENPLEVSGIPTQTQAIITNIQDSEPLQVTGKLAEEITIEVNHISSF